MKTLDSKILKYFSRFRHSTYTFHQQVQLKRIGTLFDVCWQQVARRGKFACGIDRARHASSAAAPAAAAGHAALEAPSMAPLEPSNIQLCQIELELRLRTRAPHLPIKRCRVEFNQQYYDGVNSKLWGCSMFILTHSRD